MKKLLVALTIAVASMTLTSTAFATQPNPGHKVTICHRTGSASNPYIIITTDIASDGYVQGGHTGHDQIGNGLGGDIIPAYEYDTGDGIFSFPGKNLDVVIGGFLGADILANGCSSPGVTPPPPPPPTTPPPTSPPVVKPPTHTNPPPGQPEPGQTALTGFTAAWAGVMALLLGAAGLGALWYARKLGKV